MLSHAREMRRALDRKVKLIMNDRADLCLAAGFDGVHVGQDDLSPEGARRVVGDGRIVGVSTHNLEQLKVADAGPADYIAFGPMFATSAKQNPDPVVGLEGLRAARAATGEAAGRHRRHHAGECSVGDRRRSRFRGRDFRPW